MDAARTASPEEWIAACAAMLSALTALTSKGVLELEPGIVKEAVAGRAAREVGAVGSLLLASAADGRPKTAEQVLFHRAFELFCLARVSLGAGAWRCEEPYSVARRMKRALSACCCWHTRPTSAPGRLSRCRAVM